MPLSPSQLAALSGALDRRQELLLAEVRAALEHSENQQYIELIDRVPADIGDQSVGDMLADLNLAIVDRHVEEIRAIDAARRRLRQGGYGTCVDCGQELEFARLSAFPTALRCVPCQDQHERTYAHAGTPKL
jgi:DnaK suppressor protein